MLEQRSTPGSAILRSWLNQLHDSGYAQVRTGAIHSEQHAPFQAVGFTTVQDLVLLHRMMPDARRPWRTTTRPVRLAKDHEIERLAEVDNAAFPEGWGLDVTAIVDAASATPRHRLSVIDDDSGVPIAYAISGRAGQAAFLQRLAVDPAAQRRGLGRLLVADNLRWAARWRVRTVAVNTQHDNDRALQLYESMGFVRRAKGLSVMQRALDGVW
jgi:GNAT superfamily N-acetyltransferase